MRDFWEVAEEDLGPSPEPEPTLGLDEAAVDRALDGFDADLETRNKRLLQTMDWAGTLNPETQARALRAAQRSALPVDLTVRHLELVEREQRIQDLDPVRLYREAPALATFLENPDQAAAVHDDIGPLAAIERVVRLAPAGFRKGLKQIEAGYRSTLAGLIGEENLDRALRASGDPGLGYVADALHFLGLTDPARNEARIRNLEGALAQPAGDRNPFETAILEGAQLAPQILSSLSAAVGGGALGAVGGPVAARAGTLAGPALFTWAQEFGPAYREFRGMRDDTGAPMDDDVARGTAALVASFNAGVELVTLGPTAKVFGVSAVTRRLARSEARKALASRSFREAVRRKLGSVGILTLLEGSQEVLQEAATIAGGAAGRASSGQAYDRFESEAIAKRLWETFYRTVLGTAALGGAGGSVAVVRERAQIRKAAETATKMSALADAAAASKTVQRSPESVEGIVEDASGDAERTAFVPLEAWNTYFQSKNLDPGAVAGELGQGAAYAESLATGGDVAIPVSKMATRVLPKHRELVQDVRFDPADLTPREAAAAQAERAQRQDAPAEPEPVGPPEPGEAVAQKVTEQLAGVGFDTPTAERYAALYGAAFRTLAERAGTTPDELFGRYQLKVSRNFPDRSAHDAPPNLFTKFRAAARKVVGRMQAEDIRKPEDVARWVRAQGGLAATEFSRILPGSESYRSLPVGLKASKEKGGRTIEQLAEQLVELGAFENDAEAADWIDAALRNPTGLEMPSVFVREFSDAVAFQEDRKRLVARFGEDAVAGLEAGTASIEELEAQEAEERGGQKLADLGIAADPGAGQETFRAALAAGTERVPSYELQPGEVVILKDRPDVYVVRVDEDGNIVLDDGIDVTLGDEQEVDVARVGRVDETTLHQGPSDTQRQIERGVEAFNRVMDTRGSVPGAMERADVGPITFDFGEPGDPARNYDGGWGWSHILARRVVVDGASPEHVIRTVLRTLALGSVSPPTGPSGHERVRVDWEGFRAILALHREGERETWLLTGYGRLGGKEGADATAEDLAPSGATQAVPSDSRSDLGAALAVRLRSPSAERKLEQGPGDNRGDIRFRPGGPEFNIRLLENADLSTFLHESAHFFLEVLGDLASAENAPAGIVEDYRTILDWLGVQARIDVGTEQHEQFARGFEAWLMEGKPPSRELAGVFARFRAWLVAVYKKLEVLNVTLTDPVRDVFQRLVASDEQITEVERLQGFDPIFSDAAAAGMTTDEFKAYTSAVKVAQDESRRILQDELIREKSRETKEWWREERARVESEVAAEINARGEYRALHYLRRGEMLDGSEIPDALKGPDGETYRLSRDELAKMFESVTADTLKRIPFTYRNIGGVHPDVLAPLFGFTSGYQMVSAMMLAGSRTKAIAAETDRRMLDRYGDILHDGTLGDVAQDAAHDSEARVRQLQIELNILARRSGSRRSAPADQLRESAAAAMQRKHVRDLRPSQYAAAERRAAKDAFQAAAKGDFVAAAAAKQRQMLNFFLYSEARKAREEVETAARYLHKMALDPSRARIAKASPTYLEQIDKLLERTDFRKPLTLKESDRRQSLTEWLREREAEGLEPYVPDWLLSEAVVTTWKNLTVEELLGLRDSVKSIEHVARTHSKLKLRKKLRDFDAVVTESEAEAEANMPPTPKLRYTRADTEDSLAAKFNRQVLAKLKTEELVRRLAGGNTDSVWFQAILDPINEAYHKREQLRDELMPKILDAVGKFTSKQISSLYEAVHIDSLGDSLTIGEIITIALNYGSDSNYKKMLEGGRALTSNRNIGVGRWDVDVIEEALSHLTPEHWQFVQATWDLLETLWPAIAALEERRQGLAPPKVEPRKFVRTFKDGTSMELRGGYFPVIYDSRFSRVGGMQEYDGKNLSTLFAHGAARAMTPHGHTIARVENFARPISLRLDAMIEHVDKVTHDLAFREAIISVHRFLSDDRVRTLLNRYYGEGRNEGARVFDAWLADVASEGYNPNHPGERTLSGLLNFARTNAVFVALAFRPMLATQNFANLANVKARVPSKYLGKSLNDWVRNPVATRAFVLERSTEMAHRLRNFDRDVKDQLRILKDLHFKGTRLAPAERAARQRMYEARKGAFWLIGITDQMMAHVAWMGAYHQKLEETRSEESAARYADHIVRTTLGSGATKDLAAVMRGGELSKLFTSFYTWFNTAVYNEGSRWLWDVRQAKRQGKLGRKSGLFLMQIFFGAVLAPILGALFMGDLPDDERDESWWAWGTKRIATYPLMGFVFLRHLAGLVIRDTPDARFIPALRVLDEGTKTLYAAKEVVEGDREIDALLKPGASAAQYLFGVPKQFSRTGGYLWDVWTGDEEPESFGEFAGNALNGTPRRR